MKLNLECGNDIRNGYINISFNIGDVSNVPENTKIIPGNFRNLDPLIEDESVEEIVFNPTLNTISPKEIVGILTHWSTKLRPSGTLLVKFYDVRRIGQSAHYGTLSLQELHGLLLGHNYENKTVMDVAVVKTVADVTGYDIESISPTEYLVTVELKKKC